MRKKKFLTRRRHSAHTQKTMAMLREVFSCRFISGSGDMAWPPLSPDLTFPDFFPGGYLKSKVYTDELNTLLELKQKITGEIHEITPDVLGRVMENTEEDALLL